MQGQTNSPKKIIIEITEKCEFSNPFLPKELKSDEILSTYYKYLEYNIISNVTYRDISVKKNIYNTLYKSI